MSFFLRFAISLFLAACASASASAAHNLMLYSVVSDNYVSKSEIREKIEKLRRDDRNADLMLVLINPHFLDADVLSVPLPSGITISYQRDNRPQWLARHPHTWLGGLTPGSLSTILLSNKHGLSGYFEFEGVTYNLYPIDGNLAVVVKNVQAPPVKPDEGALEPPPAENIPSSPPVSPLTGTARAERQHWQQT